MLKILWAKRIPLLRRNYIKAPHPFLPPSLPPTWGCAIYQGKLIETRYIGISKICYAALVIIFDLLVEFTVKNYQKLIYHDFLSIDILNLLVIAKIIEFKENY